MYERRRQDDGDLVDLEEKNTRTSKKSCCQWETEVSVKSTFMPHVPLLELSLNYVIGCSWAGEY